MRVPVLRPALVFCSLSLPAAAQTVWIVDDDGGPGVDFLDVEDATPFAAPGDVLLVREGRYDSAVIDKPLSLVAEADALVEMQSLFVRDVSAGAVLVSGIRVSPGLGFTAELDDVSAPVLFQDCELLGGELVIGAGGGIGLNARNCASITLVDCLVTGGGFVGAPLPAASLNASTVYLFGSTLVAPPGTPPPIFGEPLEGGIAVLAMNSSLLYAHASTIAGGAGGDSGFGCQGANGGDGVDLFSGSELRLFASEVSGGAAGQSDAGCSARDGVAVNVFDGVFQEEQGVARTLTLPALVREGTTVTVTATGAPGDQLAVGIGSGRAPSLFAWQPAPLLLSLAGSERVFLGTVGDDGRLTAELSVGELPADLAAAGAVLQLFAGTASASSSAARGR